MQHRRINRHPFRLSLSCLLGTVVCATGSIFGQDLDLPSARDKKNLFATYASKTTTPPRRNSSWQCAFPLEPFWVYSTAPESVIRPVVERLALLIPEVEQTLKLPLHPEQIRIVVLSSKSEYDRYLADNFPELPKRRAFYLQHRGPGLILTYLHDDWLTDARHECTHALLHQANAKLPSWLDEGLAEYFEHEVSDRTQHPEHRAAVQAQLRFGQVPTIDELEQWDISGSLEAKQYRDTWSTVTYLLHKNNATRDTLTNYIADLQSGAASGYLGRRLAKQERQGWRTDFIKFYSGPVPR